MTPIVHQVLLRSHCDFHGKLPPQHFGMLLAELPLAVRAAVSMAFRNRSTIFGKRPAWLEQACDIRFVGLGGNGDSVLYFEAPPLGEAAAEIYEQQILFPEVDERPARDDTAFDVLGDVLTDVLQRNGDSAHFDPHLLQRVTRFRRALRGGPYTQMDLVSRRFPRESPGRINCELVESAMALLGRTPSPQRVRVVGQLDALVASTQQFSLLLDTGEKVSGAFADGAADTLQQLWRQRVVVLGTAVYRASGRLIRLDADQVKPGAAEPSVFSQLPSPSRRRVDVAKLRKPQGPRSGIAAITGTWPGDETEAEIEAALDELS